jgi:WD40 repeat protein
LTSNAPGALAEGWDEARPAFTPDGKELFASSSDGKCLRWHITPGTDAGPPVLQPMEIPTPEKCASVSIASNVIAFTGPRGSGVGSLENLGAQALRWGCTIQGINGISPDQQWLGIFAPYTSFLFVYHLPGMERMATLRPQANVGEFVFLPTGDEVAISTRRGVEFWTTKDWTRTRILTNFTGILFSSESSTCWLITDFRTAGLYDAKTLEPLLPLPSGALPLAVSADGHHLAVSVDLRHLQVWDLEDVHNQLRELGLDWRKGSTEPPDRKR